MTFSEHRFAITGGLLAAAMVGGSVPISGLLVDFPLFTGQSVRYAIGAVLIALWAYGRRARIKLPKLRDVPALVTVVVVGMLGFNAAMIGAQRFAEPGLVAAVLGGSPLVLATVAPLLTRRRPAVRTLLGAGVVVSGVVVLSGGGSWTGPGLVLAVVTMLSEAGFTLFAVGVVGRLGGLSVALWCHVIAAVGGAVLAGVFEPVRGPSGRETAALLTVAVLTVVAFVLWYQSVAVLGADRAGVLIGMMPAAGFAVSVVVGAQSFRWSGLAGVVMVGVGCVIGLLAPRRRAEVVAVAPKQNDVGVLRVDTDG
ncbi:DMT family transporter [Actinokineospora enzanensis]|uniref:DMT family transporter n=1 Tax=Actinokineospora enzanensis TaxID=155975 RepID=UPI0003A5271D|nr:DMT family transporter [Actinokineospora enzanensis]